MDALESLSFSNRFEHHLQSGDVQFVHNHHILHARSAFSDKEGVPGRHLLRLWLSCKDGWDIPKFYEERYGPPRPDGRRGGIRVPDALTTITTAPPRHPTRITMFATTLPPCKYGAQCYRKNPAHLSQFSHPTIATKSKASSSKTSPPPVVKTDSKELEDTDDDKTDVDSDEAKDVKPTPSGAKDVKADADADTDAEDEPEDQKGDAKKSGSKGNDVLMVYGLKPLNILKNGESADVSSYKVKRVDTHYYCTCPSWRFNKSAVDARTCTHLQSFLGDEYEEARMAKANQGGATKSASPARPKRKAARAANGEDDGDDDDGSAGTPKKKSKVAPSVPNVLLAKKWEENVNPKGWWISEKLDGVRAYWDPKAETFVSRLGNPFNAPDWFTKYLPRDMSLDGELFAGRGKFSSTVSVVKSMESPYWKRIEYHVFDAPSLYSIPFEKRLEKIRALLDKANMKHVLLVKHEECKGKDHLYDRLKEVEGKGGEGLMLRKPKSLYEFKRSSTLLKVKSFYDAEAIVIGHEKGSGKNSAVMGALRVKMASGKTFKIGSGFTDKERANPPKLGAIVTYKFQELSESGIPRFPTFVGVRIDANKPSDAKIRTIVRTKSDMKRDVAWLQDDDEEDED
ncbi:hypothetical protein HDU96_005756 [Phlyctochytrium bullatum]|nr:hypothetical protein HDU96_005756 [Phlyctochytrium bullatum]